MGTIIGIDLGTTNSACAFMDRGEPRVIINEEGGRVTPSVVGFAKNGDRFVGDVAKRQLLINPQSTIHAIKRFMGRPYRDARADLTLVNYPVKEGPGGDCVIPIGGRDYTPQELSAMVLQKLKKSAEDFLGEAVTECVLTVPAYFTDRQRQATRDAGSIAGLDVLRIINEPTAAALAYVHDRRRSSTIAVYDFGGGTFDISLLKVDRDVAEVKATRGNNTLGGADIDRAVVRWLMAEFQRQHGTAVPDDGIVLQRLRDAAERAKLELSAARSTDIHLPFLVADAGGPKHLQATLDRATFERLARPIVRKTIEECRQAIADANIRTEDLEEIIMVGGSSRIPLAQEMVKDLFNRPLNKSFNPDEVVAVGAAIQGGMLEGEVKAVTLLDVTNFSLGIEVQGGRFATLIPKNTTIPTQKTQLVSTVVDNQRSVKVHVLQGESAHARDNVSLGEFELQNIQPAARGMPRIRVRFGIDANGLVNVSAKDLRSGIREQVTIEAPTGLSRDEVALLREEHSQQPMSVTPAKQDQTTLLRTRIEKQLVDIETFLRDHRGRLHRNDIGGMEAALKRGRMGLLKSSDRANLNDLQLYLERLHGHIRSKIA